MQEPLVQPGNLNEAELAMATARGTPAKQLEPLTLFHLQDALMVSNLKLVIKELS